MRKGEKRSQDRWETGIVCENQDAVFTLSRSTAEKWRHLTGKEVIERKSREDKNVKKEQETDPMNENRTKCC